MSLPVIMKIMNIIQNTMAMKVTKRNWLIKISDPIMINENIHFYFNSKYIIFICFLDIIITFAAATLSK